MEIKIGVRKSGRGAQRGKMAREGVVQANNCIQIMAKGGKTFTFIVK